MDRFEYPNTKGEKPWVMVDFEEARAACTKENKRLCSAREWTLGCEGRERLPYPYGYVRKSEVCNIDRVHQFPDLEALADERRRANELERIDQREPSGSRPDCVSPYGVYDLTGNVDEWVVPDGPEAAAGSNSRTALKGGYYGIVRARCRPATTSHSPKFKFYQVGFRCCADAAARVEQPPNPEVSAPP
jgi:formylglycine-generating enzyme required for sulfatase activity